MQGHLFFLYDNFLTGNFKYFHVNTVLMGGPENTTFHSFPLQSIQDNLGLGRSCSNTLHSGSRPICCQFSVCKQRIGDFQYFCGHIFRLRCYFEFQNNILWQRRRDCVQLKIDMYELLALLVCYRFCCCITLWCPEPGICGRKCKLPFFLFTLNMGVQCVFHPREKLSVLLQDQ